MVRVVYVIRKRFVPKEQIAEKTQLLELDYDEAEKLNNYDCTNKVLQKVIHRGTLYADRRV